MQNSKKSQGRSVYASTTLKSMRGEFEENIELMKISIKKESDRRHKLRHLLDKYSVICNAEKKHVKMIKSSLIVCVR